MFKLKRLMAAVCLALPMTASAAELSYQYDGKTYQGNDLPAAIRTQLYELELKNNEQRQQIIDQYILDQWLREQAKANNKSPDEFAAELMNIPEPDEKAMRKFYDDNWEKLQAPFEDIKDQVAGMMWAQQQQDKMKELLDRIKTEKNYSVTLPEFSAPTFSIKTKGYPFKGNANAAVTVVEFADFQCPHCKDASEILAKIAKEYADDIKVIYRHMPINASGISRKVAEGADCAAQQDKFWEYHDLAFAQQDKLNADSPLALAKELKLDEEKMKACLADEKTAAGVSASEEEARNLGVTGTPSFFINGKPFQPQYEFEKELTAAIAEAVKASKESTTETKTEPAPATSTENKSEEPTKE